MYTKDIGSLLNLLQVSGQSGTLHLTPHQNQGQETWEAELLLRGGVAQRCTVFSLQGNGRHMILQGETALQWLVQQGALFWNMDETTRSDMEQTITPLSTPRVSGTELLQMPDTPLQHTPSQHAENHNADLAHVHFVSPQGNRGGIAMTPFVAGSIKRIIPRRTRQGMDIHHLDDLPRDLRLVFALVDGQHSVQEIAQLLRRSPEQVMQILSSLAQRNLIE